MTPKEKIADLLARGFKAIASDDPQPMVMGLPCDFIVDGQGEVIREWRSQTPCPYPELLA